MDIPAFLELAKNNVLNIAMAGAAAFMAAIPMSVAPMIKQLRKWESERCARPRMKNPSHSDQVASKAMQRRPSLVVFPIASVVAVSLIILSVMDSQPVVGVRLLLVLALAVELSVLLALWLVLPLVFALAERPKD